MANLHFSKSLFEADCLEVFWGVGIHIGTITGTEKTGYKARSLWRSRVVYFSTIKAACSYLENSFSPPVKVDKKTEQPTNGVQSELF